jgi:DNA-binding MarR family transcriptional regulator
VREEFGVGTEDEDGAGRPAGDAVDRIIRQWRRERADLDPSPMGVFGRLSRIAAHARREIGTVFEQHGLNSWSFDVLATLRRAGAPYRLSPGDLVATCMVTSGTMTHRIDQLEKAGLVQRTAHPDDRRSVLIGLTAAGVALVDRVAGEHVANEARLLAGLDPAERRALEAALTRLLAVFEGEAGDRGGAPADP